MAQPIYPNLGPSSIGGVARPVLKVEIWLECKNLLNKDVTSKSDPCGVFCIFQKGHWEEVGRTENVINCLDPKFTRSFKVDYYFEEVQKVQVSIYDIDNKTDKLSDDDFLGQVECTLGQLVSSSPCTKPLILRNKKNAGKSSIIIRTDEVKEGGENAHLNFRANNLENKDTFGKSDPYLEVSRQLADGSWQAVHRTEVIKNNLNPQWRPFSLSVQTLCGGDRNKDIKFDVYDWDKDGSHDFIGSFTANLTHMLEAGQKELSFSCINPVKKAKKKKYQNSGIVYLTSCKLAREPSFLEYVMGGMQVNFTVGIDFTASNGDPKQSTSLHYINPYQPNEYMIAIQSVGTVCQDYDSDKLFPVLGFGAQIPPDMKVSHEFAVNFNHENPFCAGVGGILEAYQNCLRQVRLYGPTNVAPIINHCTQFAVRAQNDEPTRGSSAYFILLLLTDGVLTDMDETRRAIVHASSLPMSLIIVGVGNADFSDMQVLDGDDGVLKARDGEPVKRDIVQFVPFRDFKSASAEELARHVLAEIPSQVVQYYKMRGIAPTPRPAKKDAEAV